MNAERRLALLQILPGLIFLIAWQVIVQSNEKLIFFFGTPAKIGAYLVSKTMDGSLLLDTGTTLVEALGGFVLGNVVGCVVGLGLWYSKTAVQIARPYITALGSAPVFALAPLLIIWFGTGVLSKIMIATLSTVFVALQQAYTGASEVSQQHLRLMQSLSASKTQTFRKLVAPSALVWVISAFRLNVGFALLGAVLGEFISSNKGLGHLIQIASGLFDISLVLCGVLMIVVLAFLLNFAIAHLERPIKHLVVKYL